MENYRLIAEVLEPIFSWIRDKVSTYLLLQLLVVYLFLA